MFLLAALVSACAQAVPASPAVATATLSPAPTGTSSATPTTLPTHTPAPLAGTLTTQVNVRSLPSLSSPSLGLLNSGTAVQIFSRSADGAWYEILYPSAPDGRGWVAAQFVQSAQATLIPQATTPAAGASGQLTLEVHVRSGPGTSFGSLGLLQANTAVTLTGKNALGTWLQLAYSAGPGGRGWVAAQYVSSNALEALPVLDDYGTPAATASGSTAAAPVAAASPTVGLAPDDRDSAAQPAIQLTFSPGGTRAFSYSSQLSGPQGDAQDWVEFTPFSSDGVHANLVFSLACNGNGGVLVELLQGATPLSGWGGLTCGQSRSPATLPAGQTYQIHLSILPGPGQALVSYVLTVENRP